MHLLDLAMLVIIGGLTIAGAFAGFGSQLSNLISIILAAGGTWLFYPLAAYKLEGLIQSPELSVILAPVILFLVLGFLCKFVLGIFFHTGSTEDSSGGSWLFGGLFGLFKGAVLGCIIIYLLAQYGEPELVEDSVCFSRFYHASEWVISKNDEYAITEKLSTAGNYLRDKLLPPIDTREESIESAAKSFYNEKMGDFFEKDFFKSISEFVGSGSKPADSD